MKNLLVGIFITTTALSYAKEIKVEPVVIEEIEEIKEEKMLVTDYIPVEVSDPLLNNLYLRAGISPLAGFEEFSAKYNKQSEKITEGKPDSLGYELGIEYTRNLNENFELGLGTMYQSNSKIKSYTIQGVESKVGKYDSIPVYLTTRYSFTEFNNGIKPYLKGNIGYSFNFNEKDTQLSDKYEKESYSSKVTNGIYMALGGGIEYNNIGIDLMYQLTDADLSLKSKTTGIKTEKDSFGNAKLTLGVSYKFNF